jgi:hypothetical protein
VSIVSELGGGYDDDALVVGPKNPVHDCERGIVAWGDQGSLNLVRVDQNAQDILVIHLNVSA